MVFTELQHGLRKAHAQLQQWGIGTVFLFGSHATGLAGPRSDVDIGVLAVRRRVSLARRRSRYQALYELFSAIIARPVTIDIVDLDEAPLYLRAHVVRYGRVVYESSPARRAIFLECTCREYADFEPYRRRFEQAILERIG